MFIKCSVTSFEAGTNDRKFQKSTSQIIGQTRKESSVIEWETVYHEMLAISTCFIDLTQANWGFREGKLPHHELCEKSCQWRTGCNTQSFTIHNGTLKSYAINEVVKLNNLVLGELVKEKATKTNFSFCWGWERTVYELP